MTEFPGEPSVRVLLVDDCEPFRHFVRSMLGKRSEFQVVGETSDGLEAVHKAEELQPDLILMDLGLPSLNGIEATRRIRKLAPTSKVLFVSQVSSADVVEEAFRSGASGYVVKDLAGRDLLVAVEAVLQGRRFVSSKVADHILTDFEDTQSSDRYDHQEDTALIAAPRTRKAKVTRCHEVRFYSDDASFLDSFFPFIGAALKAGKAVIVVATELHRNILLQRMQAHGVDVFAAIEDGSYIPLDVADTLSTFMVNDMPDPIRFSKVASDLITAAARAAKPERPRVAACGECAY